jgi:anti-sigma factor RsiW
MRVSGVGTMSKNDLEDELRSLKLIHLTREEIGAYCDRKLDPVRRARVEAHVKECFRCDAELALVLEESAALSDHQISEKDVALVERLMEQTGPTPNPSALKPADAVGEVPLKQRFAEYLSQITASLQIAFVPVRRTEPGETVWEWRSEDGRLQARATIEENADLAILFSSTEMDLEGTPVHFRLGAFSQQTTMRRVSQSEVAAQIEVPWQFRQGDPADLTIEIV